MAPLLDRYFSIISITHGAVVWDNSDGGQVRIVANVSQNVVHSHVAGDFQNSDVAVTYEETEAIVDLSQFKPDTLPAVNATADLVLSLKDSAGSPAAFTLYRMKYVGLTTMEQSRDAGSTSGVRFVYNAGGSEKDMFTA